MQLGSYYHIYNHANGNENLFRESDNYRWFLHQYAVYITPIAETYAYCLLPNHFHFLVRLRDANDLLQTFPKFETLEKLENAALPGKQFSNLCSSYTQGFNRRFNRKGSLFLKNFKRKLIDSDHYFSIVTAYIHMNPVIHKFVKSPDEWIWSSYNSILSNYPTKIERTMVLKWFGNRNEFQAFHNQYYNEKFSEISTLAQWFKSG